MADSHRDNRQRSPPSHDATRSSSPFHVSDAAALDSHQSERSHVPQPLLPPPLRRRFPGDGLDYRRPISSTSPQHSQPVIDLTSDDFELTLSGVSTPNMPPAHSPRATRLPNFDREIIDLSEDTPQVLLHHPLEAVAVPESPEVEFVAERQLPASERRQPTPFQHVRPPDFDLTDEDFQILGGATSGAGVNGDHPGSGGYPTRAAEAGVGSMLERFGLYNIRLRNAARGHRAARFARSNGDDIIRIGDHTFIPPSLDFHSVGFDMGLRQHSPAAPTYEAPPPAPEGFTRSPMEDEVLACPNCEDELCTGESEVKRQVWVLKGCGHVRFLLASRRRLCSVYNNSVFRSTVVHAHKGASRRAGLDLRTRYTSMPGPSKSA